MKLKVPEMATSSVVIRLTIIGVPFNKPTLPAVLHADDGGGQNMSDDTPYRNTVRVLGCVYEIHFLKRHSNCNTPTSLLGFFCNSFI